MYILFPTVKIIFQKYHLELLAITNNRMLNRAAETIKPFELANEKFFVLRYFIKQKEGCLFSVQYKNERNK